MKKHENIEQLDIKSPGFHKRPGRKPVKKRKTHSEWDKTIGKAPYVEIGNNIRVIRNPKNTHSKRAIEFYWKDHKIIEIYPGGSGGIDLENFLACDEKQEVKSYLPRGYRYERGKLYMRGIRDNPDQPE